MGTVAGVILAGGQSRRMGGGDKGLLPLADRSVLAHVIDALAPQASPLALSANGDPVRFHAFGLPVIPDSDARFQGPLAGIEAGLSWMGAQSPGTSWVVTVPGDTPFIPPDLVARLVQGKGDAPMAVAISAAGLHPVIGLWPVSMAADLAKALASGERRASEFVTSNGAAEVAFAPVDVAGTALDPFFNINTPEDLERARDLDARSSL